LAALRRCWARRTVHCSIAENTTPQTQKNTSVFQAASNLPCFFLESSFFLTGIYPLMPSELSQHWTVIATLVACSAYAAFLYLTKWGTKLRVFLTFVTVIVGMGIIWFFTWLADARAAQIMGMHLMAGGAPIVIFAVIFLLREIDTITGGK
jgi:hypothetical protein